MGPFLSISGGNNTITMILDRCSEFIINIKTPSKLYNICYISVRKFVLDPKRCLSPPAPFFSFRVYIRVYILDKYRAVDYLNVCANRSIGQVKVGIRLCNSFFSLTANLIYEVIF